jgi:hypothetical protein
MRNVEKALLFLALGLFSVTAEAQRGMNADTGVARQGAAIPIVTQSGRIEKVEVGPCANTTGRSLQGVHLLIQEADGQKINLHLGPADALADVVDRLAPGQSVTFDAFRTDLLPPAHFVAKSLTLGDEVIHLRDDNLRPSWAYGGRGPGGGWGMDRGNGQGRGLGRGGIGPCW